MQENPTVLNFIILEIIRIFHGCEVRIEKSVPRVTVWHHEASHPDEITEENLSI